jgi:plastocyanin
MTAMNRLTAAAATCVLLATACGGRASGPTIFVDFQHDEFASFFIKNFPSKVTVTQGAELVFRQFWTGEPHSVTGGTLVNELMEEVRPYLEMDRRGEPIPQEPPKNIEKLERQLVWAFTEDDSFNQTAAQPCYLGRGRPRKDGRPCSGAQQEQPAFDGTQTFYNSGVIAYEPPDGNEYRVKLTDDIDPGSYWFYCNVHGEFQSTEVVVKPAGSDVPTDEDIARQAREEIEEEAEPLMKLFRDAQDRTITLVNPADEDEPFTIRGNFAGIIDFRPSSHGAVNEFIPKRIRARAGSRITWNLLGYHTISFGVPSYLPIITFADDGTVTRNPKLERVAGGAKRFDVPDKERYGGDEPVDFDGGTYDGSGFWSSGLIDAEPYIRYTMRIDKPGTYRYACLIHPPMVGTVEVI